MRQKFLYLSFLLNLIISCVFASESDDSQYPNEIAKQHILPLFHKDEFKGWEAKKIHQTALEWITNYKSENYAIVLEKFTFFAGHHVPSYPWDNYLLKHSPSPWNSTQGELQSFAKDNLELYKTVLYLWPFKENDSQYHLSIIKITSSLEESNLFKEKSLQDIKLFFEPLHHQQSGLFSKDISGFIEFFKEEDIPAILWLDLLQEALEKKNKEKINMNDSFGLILKAYNRKKLSTAENFKFDNDTAKEKILPLQFKDCLLEWSSFKIFTIAHTVLKDFKVDDYDKCLEKIIYFLSFYDPLTPQKKVLEFYDYFNQKAFQKGNLPLFRAIDTYFMNSNFLNDTPQPSERPKLILSRVSRFLDIPFFENSPSNQELEMIFSSFKFEEGKIIYFDQIKTLFTTLNEIAAPLQYWPNIIDSLMKASLKNEKIWIDQPLVKKHILEVYSSTFSDGTDFDFHNDTIKKLLVSLQYTEEFKTWLPYHIFKGGNDLLSKVSEELYDMVIKKFSFFSKFYKPHNQYLDIRFNLTEYYWKIFHKGNLNLFRASYTLWPHICMSLDTTLVCLEPLIKEKAFNEASYEKLVQLFDCTTENNIGLRVNYFLNNIFKTIRSFRLPTELWPEVLVYYIKNRPEQTSYDTERKLVEKFIFGYNYERLHMKFHQHSFQPKPKIIEFLPEENPKNQKLVFFDIDWTLVQPIFLHNEINISLSPKDSFPKEFSMVWGMFDKKSFICHHIIPHIQELMLYLIKNRYLIALFSSASEERNEPLGNQLFQRLFGEENYLTLKDQGQFKIFSAPHLLLGAKNLSSIVKDHYPTMDIKNCIMMDDIPGIVDEEEIVISYPLGDNLFGKHSDVAKDATAFYLGFLEKINHDPGEIFPLKTKIQKDYAKSLENELIKKGHEIIKEMNK